MFYQPKKSLAIPRSWRYSSMDSSRSLEVLAFKYMSFIHLNFCVWHERTRFNFPVKRFILSLLTSVSWKSVASTCVFSWTLLFYKSVYANFRFTANFEADSINFCLSQYFFALCVGFFFFFWLSSQGHFYFFLPFRSINPSPSLIILSMTIS